MALPSRQPGLEAPGPPASRYDRPLAPDPDHELTVDEVRVLWSFIHGDIMNDRYRALLRSHHGLCERHAWAHAVAEIELWEQGAGRRGGHQPFDVAVLYGDLLEEIAGQLRHSRPRRRARTLARHGRCLVCDDVRGQQPTRFVVTHAGFDPARLAEEANRMTFTTAWLRETAPRWSPLVCADCLAGREPGTPRSAGDRAIPCRPHLLHGRPARELTDDVVGPVVDALETCATRLQSLLASMTDAGRPSTPDEDAAWVAAVAWFSGWRFPLARTTDPAPGAAPAPGPSPEH